MNFKFNQIVFFLVTTLLSAVNNQEETPCTLPKFPEHGTYKIPGSIITRPGQAFDTVSLTVSCDSSYVVDGDPTVECTFGEWSGSMPKCVYENRSSPSKCILPPFIANGRYSVRDKPNAMPGDNADFALLTYTCDRGYALEGNDKITCFQGRWLDDAPQCKLSDTSKMCVLPAYPTNGRYTVPLNPSLVPGQAADNVVLNVVCDQGYNLNGSDNLLCYNGVWLKEMPTCDSSTECVLPVYPQFGSFVLSGNPDAKPGETLNSLNIHIVAFSCNPGYNLQGNSFITCSKGKWSGELPTCVRYCQVPSDPSVDYRCVTNNGTGTKKCDDYVPTATAIRATCKSPDYFTPYEHPLMNCMDGRWDYVALCSPSSCTLEKLPGVEYKCYLSGSDIIGGYRKCKEREPQGTAVRAACSSDYYPVTPFKVMNCFQGRWDFTPSCAQECGILTPKGEQLISGGESAERGEIPWHVGIYKKLTPRYKQICGGSIVSPTAVLSAAHCFWSDVHKKLPASNYAVAAGKLYRPWDESHDPDAQKSYVKTIQIPADFRGSGSNFQADIAVLILETKFVYKEYIRPVCVDFDRSFDTRQLTDGNKGKVAGWGLTGENGPSSPVLKTVEIPFVNIEECIARSPPGYQPFLTFDKFCAGFGNGTSLCQGDSGGGLAFPHSDRGVSRYYLRGVVSTSPRGENDCNTLAVTSFTHLRHHKDFIEENWAL